MQPTFSGQPRGSRRVRLQLEHRARDLAMFNLAHCDHTSFGFSGPSDR